MTEEHRKYLRRDINHTALIKFPCTVLDVSRSGARLSIDDPNALPNEFILELKTDLIRWCRVVWRRNKEVGVEYILRPTQMTSQLLTNTEPD
jgi:hypothetical protein